MKIERTKDDKVKLIPENDKDKKLIEVFNSLDPAFKEAVMKRMLKEDIERAKKEALEKDENET